MTTTATPPVLQTLITLKSHYEDQIAQTEAFTHYSYTNLLAHTNALLTDLLEQSNDDAKPEAIAQSPAQIKLQASPPQSSPQAPESNISLPFLPAFQGMKKWEAITQVLLAESGQLLHMDTIILKLYGELSPEDFKAERVRMKSALFQGTKRKLWQKTSQPYSYVLKAVKSSTPAKISAKGSKPKTPPKPAPRPIPTPASVQKAPTAARKLPTQKTTPAQKKLSTQNNKAAVAPKPQIKKPEIVSINGKTFGAKQTLTMHKDFAGLSKIDAVLKVMYETPGKPVHIDDIILRLYGNLSKTEAKAEKIRMKDVMNRGRERKLWTKARAPLTFKVG